MPDIQPPVRAEADDGDPMGLEVARIAHDLNNLLNAISGHAEGILRQPELQPPVRRDVGGIRAASERAAGLTRKLLVVGQPVVEGNGILELSTAITDLTPVLEAVLGDDISLQTELASEPLYVRIDVEELTQMLVNLLVNARDALPVDKRVQLRTAAAESSADGQATRLMARISVADRGSGMSEETRARVFEARFSTKSGDQPRGLGLSSVDAIVRRRSGTVAVSSILGAGSEFVIHLPQQAAIPNPAPLNAGATDAADESALADDPLPAKLTLLLAEDEQVIRRVLTRHLEEDGHRVLVAENGARALEIAAEFQEPIHVLITDIVMPKMGGAELAHELRRTRPATRIIYMSGYAPDPETRQRLTADSVTFLAKPFPINSLRSALKDDGSRKG